ncbi:MAG: M6 family metalloprotease domain-containing protein [Muribaculaceae bacterium]|nr:M6 family metalloprotease domain-containing protein [Muribaculaceae bacterium]
MRKQLIILSMLLCHAIAALAVPAKPGWHTITQSDGTTLKIQAVGNAFNNALLTSDGLTVARGDDGDFYYVSSITGLTSVRAHDVNQRSAAEAAFVNAQRGNMVMKSNSYELPGKKGQLNAVGSNSSASVPAIGVRRIPIILVEFTDKKFTNTKEKIIESMLTGPTGVAQYYRDQSNGMYEPVFDVYGIYRLSQNREYYGGHSTNSKDKGIGWMVTEACKLAAADSVSFKPYDTNSDYYCDVVIVIYAGVSEAQASAYHPEAIWPCNWTLEAAEYYQRGGEGPFQPNPGDPYVNHFAVFNELHGSNDNGKTIDGIGTFCHEFGHCLGLPDLYDTSRNDHYGMGNWDLMCLGCYCDEGYTPVGFSAYEKVFMGWVDFIEPEPNTYYTLPVWNQKNKDTDKAVRVKSDLNRNEYFIFENRRRQGWDRYLPGQGIMVTHITYSPSYWTNNKPNNDDVQLVTLLPADNKLSNYSESGDLWPQGSKNEVTDTSTPATVLYMTPMGEITGHAGYLGKPVTEMVINSDGSASFWYIKSVHDYDPGDVDHNGVIDIIDATQLINILLNGEGDYCTICADMNSDGKVDILDATVLINWLLGS